MFLRTNIFDDFFTCLLRSLMLCNKANADVAFSLGLLWYGTYAGLKQIEILAQV